jgi:hypothetical protein
MKTLSVSAITLIAIIPLMGLPSCEKQKSKEVLECELEAVVAYENDYMICLSGKYNMILCTDGANRVLLMKRQNCNGR